MCAYLSVYHVHVVLMEVTAGSPGNRITGNWEPPCGCWSSFRTASALSDSALSPASSYSFMSLSHQPFLSNLARQALQISLPHIAYSHQSIVCTLHPKL